MSKWYALKKIYMYICLDFENDIILLLSKLHAYVWTFFEHFFWTSGADEDVAKDESNT